MSSGRKTKDIVWDYEIDEPSDKFEEDGESDLMALRKEQVQLIIKNLSAGIDCLPFKVPFGMFLQQLNAASKKADDEKLTEALFAAARRHAKAINGVVEKIADEEGKLADLRNKVCRAIAAEFAPHFPALAKFYLTQIPTTDLTAEDLIEIVEISFDMHPIPEDEVYSAEAYASALPYLFRAADRLRKHLPAMKKARDELLALDLPDEDKTALLMSICWNYINMSTHWNASHVRPLLQEAARLGNKDAQTLIRYLAVLEDTPFFFDFPWQKIREGERFDDLVELVKSTKALPEAYKTARAQMKALVANVGKADAPAAPIDAARVQQLAEIEKRHIAFYEQLLQFAEQLLAANNKLVEEADKKTLSNEKGLMFAARAGVIKQIMHEIRVEAELYGKKDFSDPSHVSDLSKLRTTLMNHAMQQINALLKTDAKQYTWCKRATNTIADALKSLSTPAFSPTSSGIAALAESDPRVSFLRKHRKIIISVAVGLLAFVAGLIVIHFVAPTLLPLFLMYFAPAKQALLWLTGLLVTSAAGIGIFCGVLTGAITSCIWPTHNKTTELASPDVSTSVPSTTVIHQQLQVKSKESKKEAELESVPPTPSETPAARSVASSMRLRAISAFQPGKAQEASHKSDNKQTVRAH
jgi:hypothetical protein